MKLLGLAVVLSFSMALYFTVQNQLMATLVMLGISMLVLSEIIWRSKK